MSKLAVAVVMSWLSLVGTAVPSSALEAVHVTITLESNTWALNGDLVRQPMIPLLQKLSTPDYVLTGTVSVEPSRDAVTRIAIPSKFGGTQTVTISETTGGGRVLQANPTNRQAPFTAKLVNRAFNEAGTATLFGGPGGGRGGEFAVDVFTRIVLDELDIGFELLVAEIPDPGDPPPRFGVEGSVFFAGLVAELSIPIEGTAFGTGWTTGRLTVSRRVTTMRRNDDPLGTPTGFRTLTFASTGSFMQNQTSTVTPFVVEAFSGVGDGRVPTPIYGFLRAKIEGITFAPEPAGGLLLLAAAVVASYARSRRSPRALTSPGGGSSRARRAR